MVLSLLALALAPGIAIVFYIYSKDKYDREPLHHLAISFGLGVLSIVPAVIVQLLAEPLLPKIFSPWSVTYYAVLAFGIVGISEEGSKFLMLRYYAYRKPEFNEPFDGIIYSVMVSMGFATFENILYVLQHGIATGILRMFLAVPAHAAFGVIMGYHAGLARFHSGRPAGRLLIGFMLAVIFHGLYDFFLLLQQNPNVTHHVPVLVLGAAALLSWFIAMRLAC